MLLIPATLWTEEIGVTVAELLSEPADENFKVEECETDVTEASEELDPTIKEDEADVTEASEEVDSTVKDDSTVEEDSVGVTEDKTTEEEKVTPEEVALLSELSPVPNFWSSTTVTEIQSDGASEV